MTYLQAVILGIIQGITEFLPISSSAHLVITPFLLGWSIDPELVFPFGVLIQLGTMLAVIVYFHRELGVLITGFFEGIKNRDPFGSIRSRMSWLLILATIPAAVFGFLVNHYVKDAFQSPGITGGFLIVTALLLVASEFLGKRQRRLAKMTWLDALIIGIFQAFSVFPGVSRSGSTIAGLMMRNFKRTDAARFSFLLSLPIMLGAGVFSAAGLGAAPDYFTFLLPIIIGFTSAAISGYFVIRWLLGFLKNHSMNIFALYCFLMGSLVLYLYYAG
jgi:undecaprenyl-diphosphatase